MLRPSVRSDFSIEFYVGSGGSAAFLEIILRPVPLSTHLEAELRLGSYPGVRQGSERGPRATSGTFRPAFPVTTLVSLMQGLVLWCKMRDPT